MLREQLFTATRVPAEEFCHWQNRPFTIPDPKPGSNWLRESFALISERLTAFEEGTAVGRVTYSVFVPAGRGTDDLEEIIKSIADVFPHGKTLRTHLGVDTGCPLIIFRTERSGAIEDSATRTWFFESVTINWRSHVSIPFSP